MINEEEKKLITFMRATNAPEEFIQAFVLHIKNKKNAQKMLKVINEEIYKIDN